MEWLVIALIVIGIIVLRRGRRSSSGAGLGRRGDDRQLARRGGQQVSAETLAGVRRAADDDVTQFGEELQRLDADLGSGPLDEGTRQDYKRALDAYEDAKTSSVAVTHPDQIRHVTEILGDGRYAVACVRARVAGEPLPAKRAPCFFNPQHGPSVRDVTWAPDSGVTRHVPACALDAERVEAGAEPAARKVMVGSRRVPYWQAGPAYVPFCAGYFSSFGMMEGLFLGTMLGSSFGMFDGGGYDGGYSDGYDSGYDSGYGSGQDSGAGGTDGAGGADGGDFGGFDSGSDFGGMDFGGGDF